MIGYALTLVLLFPIFWLIAAAANPGLARAGEVSPVVVAGPDCTYSPFAAKQKTECGQLLDVLSKKGVPYTTAQAPETSLTIGAQPIADRSPEAIDRALTAAGYDLTKVVPGAGNVALILLAILAITGLSGITYGPVAAALAEMFPPEIRYSSLSIPYHLGTGYFGGFLPFISQYIVARTGNPFAGLWYTWGITLVALIVCVIWLRDDADGRATVA